MMQSRPASGHAAPSAEATRLTDRLPLVRCEPTISVVIAARNAEQTIQDALRSVLSQSSPATEVIVVDDMSTDGTRQRILDLTGDRLLLLDGDGRGVAAARNVGVRDASGTWVAFLDGDDRWNHDFLGLARRRIDAVPDAAACFGAATPVDDAGLVVGRHDMRELVTFEELVCGRIVPTTSATLVRRDVLLGCGGFFEGFRCLAGVEDLDLWLRVGARGACVGVTTAGAVYVVHDERDRNRSVESLRDLEHDRELVLDRLAASGAAPALVRRGRAIMRARTARYWLRARQPARARIASRSSLRTRPTAEGLATLALASTPSAVRELGVRLRRRRRAAGRLRGT
jgi:succinoglycan biosynthesis protein ExoO